MQGESCPRRVAFDARIIDSPRIACKIEQVRKVQPFKQMLEINLAPMSTQALPFRRNTIRNLLLSSLIILLLSSCGRASDDDNTVQAQSLEPTPPLQRPPVVHPTTARLTQSVLPDRLVLPAIEIDIPVVELGWSSTQNQEGQVFSEWDVAEYAAGWHKNSARLGEGGNVVMSGHNNILGSVFRELDQLKRGDQITVWADSQSFTYQIDQVMIVPEKYASSAQQKDNTKWIGPFDDNRLTLVSCWPRDDNTHRIIVVARAKG